MPDRPNILLIHPDQFRFDCLGVNGHPQVRTPHLDRLAAGGANFSHAFTPVPVCMPARNCLIYGRWSFSHGVIANADTESAPHERPATPAFSECLAAVGYTLGYVGKWQVHPTRVPSEFGFHDYVPASAYRPWRTAQGLPAIDRWANGWQGGVDPHAAPDASSLGWGATQVMELLDRYAASEDPFFIRWDPTEPHLPNNVPEPFASMYPPASVTPWPGFGDAFADKPAIQRQQLHTWDVKDWPWERWAPVVARYLGEISLIDAQVGRILARLGQLGLQDNTLVAFSTDHGDMCGAHGMVDKHYVMYDDVVRVPLILRWPDGLPEGATCEGFICNEIDLAATFCDAAAAEIPAAFEGQSLLPLLRGGEEGRADIFAAYHGNQMGLFTQRMLRNREWKYVWNATAEDELYDLVGDPGELHNRARDEACVSLLAELRARMVVWMEDVNDPVLNWWTRRQLLEGKSI